MGAPREIRLVELGPGRGTLMADLLRAARVAPGFLEAVRLDLVEINPVLREAQARALSGTRPALAGKIRWHSALSAEMLTEGRPGDRAAILIANEFLDALPVRQIVHSGGSWRERCVGLDERDALSFVLGPRVEPSGALPPGPAREGDIFEMRPGFAEVADVLRQSADVGATVALFVDYGHLAQAFGDTLQAVRSQRYVSPLAQPGTADLTAHVDFAAFGALCRQRGLAVDGPISQAEFLLKLGLAERMHKLVTTARRDQVGALESGAARISDPLGIGGLFKAVAIRSRHVPTLPPFALAPRSDKGGSDGA
jgi:SAM-dependent MidA family methyltransferase